jgi:hypothetical protein
MEIMSAAHRARRRAQPIREWLDHQLPLIKIRRKWRKTAAAVETRRWNHLTPEDQSDWTRCFQNFFHTRNARRSVSADLEALLNAGSNASDEGSQDQDDDDDAREDPSDNDVDDGELLAACERVVHRSLLQ